jgi:hypothetical protein
MDAPRMLVLHGLATTKAFTSGKRAHTRCQGTAHCCDRQACLPPMHVTRYVLLLNTCRHLLTMLLGLLLLLLSAWLHSTGLLRTFFLM